MSIKGHKGFTLVEVLINTALIAISALAMSQLFITQMKQNKHINQKLETTDLNNLLLQVFQSQALCDLNFKNLTFDITNPNNISDVNITEIKSDAGQTIIKENTTISESQSGVSIDKINLTKIKLVGAPYYQAILKISLKVESGYMPLKPINISQLFETTSISANQVSVLSCVTPGKVVTIVTTPAPAPAPTPTPTPSANLTSKNCTGLVGCWIPTSFKGSPGMEVRATSNCGTNNDLIGLIDANGTFSYTGLWDCTKTPNVSCSQSWTVGGKNVGSHSWSCSP
ncbi:MAG: prepilin-type N-terminal cleavage/methylation domain-containing protein [Bdellovibrionales bacterium]|nr:prepilin-type N-terminal cleavage/methylation domain-containing protein [Bdellovibrionales bacterium]